MSSPGQSFGDPGSANRTATVTLNADVGQYSTQMGMAAQQTNAMAGAVDHLTHRLSGLDKWAGRKLFHFAAADVAGLSGATADAATFEKQLSTLAATSAVTGSSLRGLKAGIESTFTKFGVSRGDVVALTEALSNLGVTGNAKIMSLTQTFIKLGAATGESSIGLAQGLTQLSKLMGVTDPTQIGNMANSLLTVSKNAGVSATGVLSFAQAIGPMARQAGIGEAAIIGISAAFSKAGADGYVAANTFNSMVSDITQLATSGSPSLAKYANLIGVTTGQFKKMDKTTALTNIFETISKQGPQAIDTLNRLGIDGVRAQAAITAVTQSGDLRQQIGLALGSQSDQGNLTKGANAAFDNLADSLAKMRNQFTELGTIVGTTFLTPMAKVAGVIGGAVAAITRLVKVVPGLAGGALGGLGVASALGGVALNAAGLIGGIALTRMVTRGMGVSAAKAGFAAQAGGGEGLNKRDAMFMDRYTGGQLSFMQNRMYEAGMGGARFLGADKDGSHVGDLRKFSTWRNLGIMAPFRAVQALNSGQASMLRESTRDSFDRLKYRESRTSGLTYRDRFNRMVDQQRGLGVIDVLGRETVNTLHSEGNLTGGYINAGADQLGPVAGKMLKFLAPRTMVSLLAGLATGGGVPLAGSMANKMLGQPLFGQPMKPGQLPGPANLSEATKNFQSSAYKFGVAMAHPIKSFDALTLSARQTAVALKDVAAKTTGFLGAKALQGTGNLIANGTSMAWQGLKGAFQLATSFPGMLALSGGLSMMSHLNKEDQGGKLSAADLNPIQRYNDLLGTTTTNLANFSNALTSAAAAASGGGKTMTMDQAMTVTSQAQSTAPKKATNGFWNAIRKSTKGEARAYSAAQALALQPLSDPKQVYAAQQDMFSSGFTLPEVKKAFEIYKDQGGANRVSGLGADLGGAASQIVSSVPGTEGLGHVYADLLHGPFIGGGGAASKPGKALLGLAISGIGSQQTTDASQVGGVYAQQKALASYTTALSPLLDTIRKGGDAGRGTAKALANTLSTITGGSESSYLRTIGNMDISADPKKQEQQFVDLLGRTDKGKQYLGVLGKANGGTTNVSQFDSTIAKLAQTPDASSFNGLLRTAGPLGTYAATNADVQGSLNKPGSPGAENQSIQNLLDKATALGGGLEGAITVLGQFQGALGDNTSELYKQITAAQQLAAQQTQYRQPFQTRGQNFASAINQYKGASAAYYGTAEDKRTTEQHDWLMNRQQNYEQALADNQQYQTSMYQAAQQFGIQQARAEQDYELSVSRSRRNFRTQMLNTQFDFNRQESRAAADHATQLANQAASEAQNIYDPFNRVQAKFTIDAGTLLQNLQEQNGRIAQQRTQLTKVKKMGLSEQAIQELNLADPNNSQQLDNIMQTITSNPRLIAQLNAQVSARVRGTRSLTQSPDTLAFAQGQAEYHRQLARAQQDYDTATARAEQQQGVALGDMATDYNTTVKRAGQDLTTAMTEVTGTFGAMYDKTMGQIAQSVQKFSPQAAAQMRKDLQSLVAQFPFLKDGSAADYNPNTPTPTPSANAGEYGGHHPHAAPRGANVPRNAEGGISVGPQMNVVSEWSSNAAELHLPLNKGARYFDGLGSAVARHVLQAMHTSGRGVAGQGLGATMTINEDHSTTFAGEVHVIAQDPNEMARKLKDKARLSRLSHPPRR